MDLQADVLFFQAREQNAAFAIVEERVIEPDFRFHMGFRALVGTDVGCEGTKVALQYFHYHARTRSSISKPVIPIWGHLSEEVIEGVSSMWRLHMGLVDLLVKRCWSVSSCLELTPLFALTYAEVRRKSDLEYGDVATFSMKNKYWAVGPKVGLEMLFGLMGDWSLYGRGAMNLLYGKFYHHLDEEQIATKWKQIDEFQMARLYYEAALGLNWSFCLGSWSCFLRGAGELYLLSGHGRYPSTGDLSLIGASLSLGVEF